MPLTRTLAQLRDSVQRTADIRAFTDRHSDASVNDLINRGCGALQRLFHSVNPEFRPIASTTITADGENTVFALPATFRHLISVEYSADGAKTWLNPYEMYERAALDPEDASEGRAYAYRLLGTNIELLPLPTEDHTALVWYGTTATQLSADGDTIDVSDRLDDYIIWWAAREIAMDRADWDRHDRLSQKIASLEDEIRIIARTRDVSMPSRVVDVRTYTDRYGRSRYR